ncbi:MAG: CtsR family transcriptional regulator [Selenomonadaceae bacterium]|nr:CtsR family transcriptional regulator [Selenomonadaceae bacterium]
MMNNKADTIEKYILDRLSEQHGGKVELKRTALAGEINCAPSQISYVLSTRFTHERGFRVESQRGMGGYIRITIVTDEDLEKKIFYSKMIEKIDEFTPFEVVKGMLDYLVRTTIITRREGLLISQMALELYRNENIKSSDRVEIIRSIFKTLADNS